MLPFMRSRSKSQTHTFTGFGGVNPSYSRKQGELKSALNMSSEKYPAICSMASFESLSMNTLTACGSGFYDRLYTVRHGSLDSGDMFMCSDDLKVTLSQFDSPTQRDADRKMSFMKNKCLVIPDNVIYHTDTQKTEECNISQTITQSSSEQKFYSESGTTASLPMPYNIWYSGSLTSKSIKSMSATYQKSSTGYRFYHFVPYESFEPGDVVYIKMEVKPIDEDHDDAYYEYLEKMRKGFFAKIKDTVKVTHDTPKGEITETTELVFDDNIIDKGGYSEVLVLDITIEKTMPEFVDICTSENRIWGVTKDTIHTSKLGDPSEWNDFSVDSYGTLPSSCFKTEVETDRNFTAITAYNGNVLAFKEDCIHKVYGSQPDEYMITTIECPGVEEGARQTLAAVGGVLYYKGKDGIYSYNGGMPKLISLNLSLENTKANYGGGDDRYYYICIMKDNKELIYIYDTYFGIWHIKDNVADVTGFVKTNDGIIVVTKNHILKRGVAFNDMWDFTLDFGTKEFASKHFSKISLRYTLLQNSAFNVWLENKHEKYLLASVAKAGENQLCSVRIPVTCGEDATLTFKGMGSFEMTSLSVEYTETSIKD